MEVPRLGVRFELLWLLAYATATAMRALSHIFDLHHSSRQHRILNSLSEAREQTLNLMVPSEIRFHCAKMGIPVFVFFLTSLPMTRIEILSWGLSCPGLFFS